MAINFSVPTPLTDIVLIVEGKRLHVSRNYLAHHSVVFHKMLFGEFIEGKQKEVSLTGPENLKYDEFMELLKIIYLPQKQITALTCRFLLKLADFYQIENVVEKCDKFLKYDLEIPVMEKLYLVDKYKLSETKVECLNSRELRNPVFARGLSKKPEYSEMSAEFKNVLFESILNRVPMVFNACIDHIFNHPNKIFCLENSIKCLSCNRSFPI